MDVDNNGYLSFQEFYQHFSNVILHWSSLINKHVKLNKQLLQDIFNKIDTKKRGVIHCREYSATLAKNPHLLDWFLLLHPDGAGLMGGKTPGAPTPDPAAEKLQKRAQRKQLHEQIQKDAKIQSLMDFQHRRDLEVQKLRSQLQATNETAQKSRQDLFKLQDVLKSLASTVKSQTQESQQASSKLLSKIEQT